LSKLNGVDNKPAIMNSMDFVNMEFETLGFTGKWLELIGDPSSNFTAMVFGKPKMGKSYLCVDFAGYLARNHGKVLYVAKEEGLDYTLQQKLNDKNVKHPNLFVASILPDDLSPCCRCLCYDKSTHAFRSRAPGNGAAFEYGNTGA
jgi:hypothetical protein